MGEKKRLESPVRHLPRGDGEFELEAYASLTHVGAILDEWQIQPNGEKEKVLLGFWSKKLNPAQRNYAREGTVGRDGGLETLAKAFQVYDEHDHLDRQQRHHFSHRPERQGQR